MIDTSAGLLAFARGPGFTLAASLLAFGVALRLVEILMLGRKPDLSVARGGSLLPALRMVWSRFAPPPGGLRARPLLYGGGYLFHIAFFVVLLLFRPHIEVWRLVTGLSWPGLSSPLVDAASVAGMAGLLMVLATRLTDPAARFLSTLDDYLSWGLTLAPLLTGYAAVHRLGLPYEAMLAAHVLSVDLLLALFPFTKLMHGFTWVLSRGYAGAMAGRKGVRP